MLMSGIELAPRALTGQHLGPAREAHEDAAAQVVVARLVHAQSSPRVVLAQDITGLTHLVVIPAARVNPGHGHLLHCPDVES